MYISVLGVIFFSVLTTFLILIAKKQKLSQRNAFVLGALGSASILILIFLFYPDNTSLLLYDNKNNLDYISIGIVILIPLVVGYEVQKWS